MTSILFVCLGNICRSPMAEAIFMHKLKELGIENQWHVDSAGTASYHIGSRPDDRTMRVLDEEGIEYTHKARAVSHRDFQDFDYIVPMDNQNRENLLQLCSNEFHDRILFAGGAATKETAVEIPDPYYGGNDDFYQVYSLLDKQMNHLLQRFNQSKAV